MKRQLIDSFRKLRERFYGFIKRPRIYYDTNPYLEPYHLPKADLEFYRKNSLTNSDLLEFLKKFKS